jgi:cysteine desulfurase
LRDDTVLASVMFANNEIGVVQPIAQLAAAARERGVIFHADAVQGVGLVELRPRDLGVDLLSLSAHKFYGPKGVGVLYVRDGLVLPPLVHGGGQEFGRRSGTENVAGIIGLAAALERAVAGRAQRATRIGRLRDRLEAGIRAQAGEIRINGEGAPRLPNNSNISFAQLDSEALLMRFDLEGIAVSAGSVPSNPAT